MKSKTRETAQRLNIIRILTASPNGLTLEELKKASGIESESELKQYLGKLYMVGVYPYTPLDYLEVDYDGNRVRLHFPQNLRKTLALTPKEWMELRNSLESEKKQPGQTPNTIKTIDSILDRIKKIVPYESIVSFLDQKKIIQEAIRTHKHIRFTYTNRDGVTVESRTVAPWFLVEDQEDYLIGFCTYRNDARSFRLSSINDLTLDTVGFLPPDQSISKPFLHRFQEFLNKARETGAIAKIWHTRESFYYLNQKLQLTPTGNIKTQGTREYMESSVRIREDNWFLEQLIPFLPDVILEEPSYLKDRLRVILATAWDKTA